MKLKWASVQQIVLFFSGLALLFYETVLVAEPRTPLLLLAAGMLGIPATIVADRGFTARKKDPPGDREAS